MNYTNYNNLIVIEELSKLQIKRNPGTTHNQSSENRNENMNETCPKY